MPLQPPITIEEFERKNSADRMNFLDRRLKHQRIASPHTGRPLPVRISETSDRRHRAGNRGNGHY